MSNSRLVAIGACIAVLAAALAAGVQWLMGGSGRVEEPNASVVVAKSDLSAGHRLVETDVEVSVISGAGSLKGATRQPKTVVGRTLGAAVRKGQPLKQEDLAPRGTGADLVAQLPPGHRALTVVLRDPVAGTALFPGATVDVLVTMDRAGAGAVREAVTRTAIERARVLAVNDETGSARATPGSDGTQGQDRKPSSAVRKLAVTLDVTPEQAAQLELAASKGSIGLALRGAEDTSPSTASASTHALAGAPAAPTAAPTDAGRTAAPEPATKPTQSKPPTWDVTVIRGDDRVKHEFPERTPARTP